MSPARRVVAVLAGGLAALCTASSVMAAQSVPIGDQSDGYQTVADAPCSMSVNLAESPQQTALNPTVHVDQLSTTGTITCWGPYFDELQLTLDGNACFDGYNGNNVTSGTYTVVGSCSESQPAVDALHTVQAHFIVFAEYSQTPEGPCSPDPTNNQRLFCNFTLRTFVAP
jgi:hypothetical protein